MMLTANVLDLMCWGDFGKSMHIRDHHINSLDNKKIDKLFTFIKADEMT